MSYLKLTTQNALKLMIRIISLNGNLHVGLVVGNVNF